MPLFQALSFLHVTTGRKKIPCTWIQPARVMLHASRSLAKQSASNRHWLTKLLHWLLLLVLLRVWLLFGVLLLLVVTAAALLIGADSQAQQSQLYSYRFIKWHGSDSDSDNEMSSSRSYSERDNFVTGSDDSE